MAKIELLQKSSAEILLLPKQCQLYLSEYTSDDEGRIYISSQIMSIKEGEEQIELLIKQLQQIKKKIKPYFSK